MFLQKADLMTQVMPEIVDMITRYDDTIILTHLVTAESEIESHLVGRYDIRPELEKTGANRNALLLQIAKTIAICYLYQPLETIPDKITKSCERAAKLLEMLADGRIKLPGVAAPIPDDTATTGSEIGWGSTPRRPTLV
ncbi:phage protein Gp36 family protein [Spirosoma aerolatum]|uniref:phage protein Gp36 family protein n=1 Tax=Spirosoma aerolatum TaxID=1211326 RepID=UPI0009AC7017|nr:phage protein Gp36 family protein [Spirosoma aerolatum]